MVQELIRKGNWVPEQVTFALKSFKPQTELGKIIKNCFDYLPPEQAFDLLGHITSTVVTTARLGVAKVNGCPEHGPYNLSKCHVGCVKDYRAGEVDDWGLIPDRMLVTAHGVLYICNNLAGTASYLIANFNFHGIGTGATAATATDTILQTELTTEYNPNSTRATGTGRTAAASGNNATYVTVGTNTLDSGTPAVTEWGLFTQAATGAEAQPGNVMLDHKVFSAVNLVGANGDGLQTTYTITVNSGG